ncbi:MAG: hypothetical protein L0Y38_00445 [Methylococcaceae bacterium]|nr:hypothetical protein [Methylococcaceae bacterium]MCI0732275.1 hypothetical protein [Methylococcaceae bacterium]
MHTRTLLITIALLAAFSPVNADPLDSDDSLKHRILGTWRGEYEWNDQSHPGRWIKARSTDHYQGGLLLVGSVDYEYPDRKDNVSYEARWNIIDGYLVIEITQSSSGYLKSGTKTRDKILSLSDRKMELLADDGKIVVLQRSD